MSVNNRNRGAKMGKQLFVIMAAVLVSTTVINILLIENFVEAETKKHSTSNQQEENIIRSPSPTINSSDSTTNPVSGQITGLTNYKSSHLGFSINFPAKWKITELDSRPSDHDLNLIV